MRKHLLVAGIAAAALIPTFASAQQTCEQQRDNRVIGTVAGAGIGALIGGAVAGHDNRAAGVIIGGVGGAVVGNQLAQPTADCAHAYGYYDHGGMWHASATDRANARGYYDRDGAWVDGAPNGYYDSQGRWTPTNSSSSASGYYDSHGQWAPASADGYYDASGQWVGGAASGYYDSHGDWVEGPATGHYDRNGVWTSGQPSGHRDADGAWVADAQPGYYANGRWIAGPARGYYDTQGRWIATAPAATSQGSDAAYQGRSNWAGAPADVQSRESWLQRRILRGMDDGSLSRQDGHQALRSLDGIRRQEMDLRYRHGALSPRDQAYLQGKLDDLSNSL